MTCFCILYFMEWLGAFKVFVDMDNHSKHITEYETQFKT